MSSLLHQSKTSFAAGAGPRKSLEFPTWISFALASGYHSLLLWRFAYHGKRACLLPWPGRNPPSKPARALTLKPAIREPTLPQLRADTPRVYPEGGHWQREALIYSLRESEKIIPGKNFGAFQGVGRGRLFGGGQSQARGINEVRPGARVWPGARLAPRIVLLRDFVNPNHCTQADLAHPPEFPVVGSPGLVTQCFGVVPYCLCLINLGTVDG